MALVIEFDTLQRMSSIPHLKKTARLPQARPLCTCHGCEHDDGWCAFPTYQTVELIGFVAAGWPRTLWAAPEDTDSSHLRYRFEAFEDDEETCLSDFLHAYSVPVLVRH